MATLNEILGGESTLAGLLGAEAQAQAEQRAQNAALLNFSLNALMRSQGQPGQGRPGLGQVLASAAIPAVSAYQQSFDKTLTDALKGLQIQDYIRKQQESQQLRTLLPQVFQVTRAPATQEEIVSEQGTDYLTRPGGVSGVKIDPTKLQALMMLPGGMEAVRGLAETQKIVRQAGLGAGGEAPSPFAPYLEAQSPEVRKLAQTYEKGFASGTIDEETAYKRVEALGKMEDSYVSRVESATDRRIAREEAREERRLTREQAAKPTEGEKKTATLAGRLEKSLTDLEKIGQENPQALKPEITPSLLQSGLLSYIPGAEMLAGKFSTADRLRAEAAQLDALDAALTLGTGAAYTREQLRGYAKAYFPQVGDTPEVIAEKNDRFANIVRLARAQAGTAYVPPSGETPNISDVRRKHNLEGKK